MFTSQYTSSLCFYSIYVLSRFHTQCTLKGRNGWATKIFNGLNVTWKGLSIKVNRSLLVSCTR